MKQYILNVRKILFFVIFCILISTFFSINGRLIITQTMQNKHTNSTIDSYLISYKNSNNQIISEDFIVKSLGDSLIYLDPGDPSGDIYKYNQLVFDSSLYYYMGIDQIHKDLTNGIMGYNNDIDNPVTVVVFDNLVDFKHENLLRMEIVGETGNEIINWVPAVDKIVLLNNEFSTENKYFEITTNDFVYDIYDYENRYFSKFTLFDYLSDDIYSHGTSVAGIINQIAPGARIISVACPPINDDIDVLYEVVLNLLQWLEDYGDTYNVHLVNISNRWGDANFGEFSL